MLKAKWHIVLLNGLQAYQSEQRIERFRTQKTGELLALLALNAHRPMSREEIAGVIWPESDLISGRASLRTALASLRQQLEPPGTGANSILLADRVSVRLCSDAVYTDVSEFEAACRRAERAASLQQRLQDYSQAVDLYAGDLLPGYYADWIMEERARLAQVYSHHLRHAVIALQTEGQVEQALHYARRLLTADHTRKKPVF